MVMDQAETHPTPQGQGRPCPSPFAPPCQALYQPTTTTTRVPINFEMVTWGALTSGQAVPGARL